MSSWSLSIIVINIIIFPVFLIIDPSYHLGHCVSSSSLSFFTAIVIMDLGYHCGNRLSSSSLSSFLPLFLSWIIGIVVVIFYHRRHYHHFTGIVMIDRSYHCVDYQLS